jgi:hypothetical protein
VRNDNNAAADLRPGVVAGKHPVGADLIRRRKDESVRESKALSAAPKPRCGSGDRGGDRLDLDREI